MEKIVEVAVKALIVGWIAVISVNGVSKENINIGAENGTEINRIENEIEDVNENCELVIRTADDTSFCCSLVGIKVFEEYRVAIRDFILKATSGKNVELESDDNLNIENAYPCVDGSCLQILLLENGMAEVDNDGNCEMKEYFDAANGRARKNRIGKYNSDRHPNDEGTKENYQLPVSLILQEPELPNGCEVTSLAMVMNYEGYPVDKCFLSDNCLKKKNDLAADPNEYYLFEPRTEDGYYCFPPVLINALNTYDFLNSATAVATNLTGSPVDALYKKIRENHPVVFWGTLCYEEPYVQPIGLYDNLHCMVLIGYTDNTVTVLDPLYGDSMRIIKRKTFERIYKAMGSMAIYVD